jgi:serine protease Do
MRQPIRTFTKTLIVMAVIAVGFAGASLFGGDEEHDRHVIIEKHGHSVGEKAWLGVYLGDIEVHGEDHRDDPGRGIRILSVIDDSPAQKAGIEDGDLIIAFNGIDIKDEDDFYREFRNLLPDDAVDVIVLRDGDEENLEVILGQRADRSIIQKEFRIPSIHIPEMRKRGYIGVHLQELTDELREYFDVAKGEGILISKVEDDSPAEDAGLRAGDVLTDADGEVIRNTGDLIKALRGKESGDPIDITYYRDGRRDGVTVTLDETESTVFDLNTFIWCDDEGDEDCEATIELDSGGNFAFGLDSGAFKHSMHQLNEYFNSEDFQKMIQDYSSNYESMERDLEKKMQELELKLQELEERLQELREEEEASKNRREQRHDRVRRTGQV